MQCFFASNLLEAVNSVASDSRPGKDAAALPHIWWGVNNPVPDKKQRLVVIEQVQAMIAMGAGKV